MRRWCRYNRRPKRRPTEALRRAVRRWRERFSCCSSPPADRSFVSWASPRLTVCGGGGTDADTLFSVELSKVDHPGHVPRREGVGIARVSPLPDLRRGRRNIVNLVKGSNEQPQYCVRRRFLRAAAAFAD